jgi:exodeoxyribonuclease V alpha subunit
MNAIFSLWDNIRPPAATKAGLNPGQAEFFSPIDVTFGRFLQRISAESNPYLFAAATLLSRSVREGNVCLDLHDALSIKAALNFDQAALNFDQAALNFDQAALNFDQAALNFDDSLSIKRLNLPENLTPEGWQEALLKSSVVGRPGELKPLILDDALRLYLFRYWEYEKDLLDFLIEKGRHTDFGFVEGKIETCKKALDRLFPDALPDQASKNEPDWQKVAACSVLLNKLTIINGGPGTGKTLAIARAMILLLELSNGKMPRIALAAPTGKAAARLQQAIQQAADAFISDPQVLAAMPKAATTIHRLIGSVRYSSHFRWNRENPLPFDVVVFDEASMVDLGLMVKLIRALPDAARLIMLGDRDQLASVEAGAILGDICGYRQLNDFSADFAATLSPLVGAVLKESQPQASPSPLRNSLIELTRNYRFSGQSKISRLSSAIKRGDGAAALAVLQDRSDDSCRWLELPSTSGLPLMMKDIIIYFKEYFDHIDNIAEYENLFDIFDRFRILCGLRHGPYGAIEINRLCEQTLYREGVISARDTLYPGRPVMITTNNYTMKLFNGDTGFILPDPERGGELSAFFRNPNGGLRRVSPVRLPTHETLYAMTVHKSQGSEFDHVLLILPDYDAPVLTRELIYTAVTRTRKTVTILGREDIFVGAVSRRLKRSSGLRDALALGTSICN